MLAKSRGVACCTRRVCAALVNLQYDVVSLVQYFLQWRRFSVALASLSSS